MKSRKKKNFNRGQQSKTRLLERARHESPSFHYNENFRRDFEVLCKRFNYEIEFGGKIRKQAKFLKEDYQQRLKDGITANELAEEGRVDLRKELIFTIDGDDAKDFDDGVSLKKTHRGYELGVHIADVSHFISLDSGLDFSARKRGNSVYLIDHVLPMFPEEISNYVCSLVEGEDRMTVTCAIDFNLEGRIRSYRFFRSLIHSQKRLTYQQVEKNEVVEPMIIGNLKLMDEFKTLLREKRIREGSIDFVTQEKYFVMEDGEVKDILQKTQLNSEKLIEEFMLIANQCAAWELEKRGVGVYRIHETPKEEKIFQFERAVFRKNQKLPKEGFYNPMESDQKVRPNRFALFLKGLKDLNEKKIFSLLLLRSMNQAVYSTQNMGHYGLAFKAYTHFTSPIRRYPDLMVHRMLLNLLSDRPTKIDRKKYREQAKWSSETERKAVDAEREYHKLKSMRYLETRYLSEKEVILDCVITGFSPRGGVYVQEVKTGIEGMVESYRMDPMLVFNEDEQCLKDGRHVVFELNGAVRVKLESLDFERLHINFSIIDKNE